MNWKIWVKMKRRTSVIWNMRRTLWLMKILKKKSKHNNLLHHQPNLNHFLKTQAETSDTTITTPDSKKCNLASLRRNRWKNATAFSKTTTNLSTVPKKENFNPKVLWPKPTKSSIILKVPLKMQDFQDSLLEAGRRWRYQRRHWRRPRQCLPVLSSNQAMIGSRKKVIRLVEVSDFLQEVVRSCRCRKRRCKRRNRGSVAKMLKMELINQKIPQQQPSSTDSQPELAST